MSGKLSDAQAAFVRKYITEPGRSSGAEDTPRVVSLVQLQKARLLYGKTLAHARDQLKALEGAIVRTFKDQPDAEAMAKSAKKIYGALRSVDMRLISCLDEALNADDPAERARLQTRAAGLIDEYTSMMNDNPVIGIIDDNPIYPVTVRKALEKSLGALKAQLA
ncbi:MAG: hypothetical protein AAF408_07685 [Pseudomonadota bacterium]